MSDIIENVEPNRY